MPDLHEQLATRLFDVVQKARRRQLDPNTPYCEAQFTEYKDLADECIRQMEWARRQHNCDEIERYEAGVADLKPLTAAPEDWKP